MPSCVVVSRWVSPAKGVASLSRPDVVEGESESGVPDRGLVLTGSDWKRCSSEFEERSID